MERQAWQKCWKLKYRLYHWVNAALFCKWVENCVYIAYRETNTACKFEHIYIYICHLKLEMLYSLIQSLIHIGWKDRFAGFSENLRNETDARVTNQFRVEKGRRQKPETALEKSLAPRVHIVLICIRPERANKWYRNTLKALLLPNTVNQKDAKPHTAGLGDTQYCTLKSKIPKYRLKKKLNTAIPWNPMSPIEGSKESMNWNE